MVQRKAPNQLGIGFQADHHHVKSEKRLANLKATSYQNLQDVSRINRGPEMKKKTMKKSRSIKNIESLRSSSTLKKTTISQPGKPPPLLNVSPETMAATTTTTTPQKQPVMRTAEGSPNYMKSTSSSAARKESSQVSSSRNTPITVSDDRKKYRRRNSSSNSKASSGCSSKTIRSLTKSSSLMMVRTLTKTPSFKHVRAASKTCSRVVICADMNAQRSTCSSTLKDTKFPAYLSLSPGATEAEGTSAMKVCPYTYCSLNGHHHTPLPPLKCFLSARRRMLKTQKGMKLEALSPRRVKPIGEEIDARRVIFVDKPAYKEEDFDGSPRSPLIKEGGMEFFIEIYAKNKEGKGESPFRGCDEVEVEHNNDKQVAVSLSDGSPHSEIDFDDKVEQYGDIISIGIDASKGFPEKQKLEDPDKDYLSIVVQNEAVLESFYNGSDFEEDCSASSEGSDSISEVIDMEWEESQFSTLEPDTEANYSIKRDDESDLDDGYLSENNNHNLHDEPIIKSENIFIGHKEILADKDFEEESASFDIQGNDSDSEIEDRSQNLEIAGFNQVSDSSTHDQQLSTEQNETDLTGVMVASATVEPSLELIASSEENQEKNGVPEAENEIPDASPKLEDVEMYYNPEVADETLEIQNQISDAFQNSGGQDFEDRKTDTNVATSDVDVEKKLSNTDVGVQTEEPVAVEKKLSHIEAGVQTDEPEQVAVTKRSIGVQFPEIEDQMEEEEQVAVTKISIGIQNPDFSDSIYEEDQDDAEEDVNQHQEMTTVQCQLEDFAADSNSSQDIADENQEHSSENQNGNVNVTDYQNLLEKDEEKKFKIRSSMDFEEPKDSSKNKISLAETDTGEVEKMEVEESNQPDTTETSLMTTTRTIPEQERTSFLVKSKSNPEPPVTCCNQKWKIGSRRTIIDEEEELRKFNPKDPNYLHEVPEPDPEKVDLRHQMMDERKNSEEWMVDFALRQTVNKLAPARKRKVALLVEAFETITPVPKYESYRKHSSASFAPARQIQACN
ncbi:hypothetical protein Ddye_031721 [Dipteronia dyeriana]|uniref:Calmodulin-binding domain-containing protein n=1 Tax=Dipteronia dyeriana TaxID=168575 RepID=A0AAD9WMJ9_9ROSI|nr:hypothetical protein Ddye_031721 [Dipteronia dyeriana]